MLLPDRSCSRAAEDQTNLSKEFSLVHGSKDNSSILTHYLNSTTVDEKHLHQKLAMGGMISFFWMSIWAYFTSNVSLSDDILLTEEEHWFDGEGQ